MRPLINATMGDEKKKILGSEYNLQCTSYSQSSNSITNPAKLNSLVPYGIESSDSSSDETKHHTKGSRKKLHPSPRKRKRTHQRSQGSKLFPKLTDEELFQDAFPTDSDGMIDVNRLLDSNQTDWALRAHKTLQQFCKDSPSASISKVHSSTNQSLSDTEYELDLSTLELVPTLIKQKKRLKEIKDDDLPHPEFVDQKLLPIEDVDNRQHASKDEDDKDTFATPKLKPKCRKFIFKPFTRQPDDTLIHDEHKPSVEIIIPEQLAASYGLYIWPCSPVLAWYIWLHQDEFKNKNILELGSGTALPGLLCAKIGANKVWLSDDSFQPRTLKNCTEAVSINNLSNNVHVIGLSWGDYTSNLIKFRNDPLDYIIGSDLFFDPKVFEPLVKTISYLLDSNETTNVLITVQERSSDWSLEENLTKWNLCCDYIYPREFLKGTGIDESDLIGGHTIFILRVFKNKERAL